jgi:hypothetical protein
MERARAPLFQTFWKKKPTGRAMSRSEAHPMSRRVCSGLSPFLSRANGITANVENKGTLETARKIAAHEKPRTTTLYDRTDDRLTLDEIEKISV